MVTLIMETELLYFTSLRLLFNMVLHVTLKILCFVFKMKLQSHQDCRPLVVIRYKLTHHMAEIIKWVNFFLADLQLAENINEFNNNKHNEELNVLHVHLYLCAFSIQSAFKCCQIHLFLFQDYKIKNYWFVGNKYSLTGTLTCL